MGPCDYCNGAEGLFVPVDALTSMFQRVVRKNYCRFSDLSQSGHVDPLKAGENLPFLVDGDFSVFSQSTDSEELLFDILNANRSADSDQYYDPHDLYASQTDDWLHRSLSDWWEILKDGVVRYGHSYRWAQSSPYGSSEVKDAYEVLKEQLATMGTSLAESTPFWRARRGAGHTGEALAAPPPHLANGGRGNLQGQPVLYLCTEKETSVSEVRPSIGDTVSVGQFKPGREVLVCDLRPTPEPVSAFVETDEQYAEFERGVGRNEGKRILGRELSKPVRRDDEAKDYLPTQALVQLIAELGFDGVAYASAQRPGGSNFLFFDPEIATQSGASEEVHIAGVNYTFK